MLAPHFQARNLIRIAVEKNSVEAVRWLHKVWSTEVTDLRYVAVVYGLKVTECVTIKNGVRLVPLAELPISANSIAVKRQTQAWPGPTHYLMAMMFPIGAMLEVAQVTASGELDDRYKNSPVRSDVLEQTVNAFTLVDGAAPVVGPSWLEFSDPDLGKAEYGQMWTVPTYEGDLVSVQQIDINREALQWLNRYLELRGDIQAMCDVAIDRLNLARRRQSPGNKAIEGAVCLEALLGDDDERELTYKLGVRAALLLGTDLAERREIKKAVRDFYKLRSATVHGRSRKLNDASRDVTCAAKGVNICSRVLQEIARRNEKPVPGDWELSGGPIPLAELGHSRQ
jgi:hypothetical protein